MEKTITPFECCINTTDPSAPLSLKIFLDKTEIYSNDHVREEVKFRYDIEEDDQEHELFFVMSGKTQEHTLIDASGAFLQDASLIIKNITFDEIDVEMLVVKNATYAHDFNGTQQPTTTKFYGEMGCNGTVNLKFSTPIYLWLLENM